MTHAQKVQEKVWTDTATGAAHPSNTREEKP